MNRTYYVRTLIFSVAILDRRRRRPLTDSLPPAPRGGDARRAGPPRPPPPPSLPPVPLRAYPSSPSFVPILPLVEIARAHRRALLGGHLAHPPRRPAPSVAHARAHVPRRESREWERAQPSGAAIDERGDALAGEEFRHQRVAEVVAVSGEEVIRARGPSPLEVGEDGDELGVGEVGLAEVAALLPGEREVGVHARCALVHARAVAGAALVAKLRHLGRVRDVLQLDVGVADGKAQPLGERRENPAPVHA